MAEMLQLSVWELKTTLSAILKTNIGVLRAVMGMVEDMEEQGAKR